jgi:hypothetical protein
VGDNSLFWLQPEPGQLGQNVLFPDDEIAQLPGLFYLSAQFSGLLLRRKETLSARH